MNLLTVSGISFQETTHVVLQDISFTQMPGQKIALAGETGAGKSTLLQIIAGLIQPSAGRILLEDKRVRGPAEQLVPGHPAIAYLTQQSELPQFLRVEQVLRYANKRAGQDARALYELCQIEHLLARRTDHVSGGERQRIALARLLLTAPKLLLLDEPFSNLDRAHKQVLKSVLHAVSERLNITCLLISHDPADTLSWADEILVLKEGRIRQAGPPKRIYQQPADPYTAALFGDYNLLSGVDMQTLASVANSPVQGSAMLIRPENFRLGPATDGGLPGTATSVRYFGSYYEVDVALATSTVTVKTATGGIGSGDAVFLSLAAADIWYLEA